ncbi:MAG: ATP-binding protein, partial [Candidatus Hydrothermarchaeaceae archaeon]
KGDLNHKINVETSDEIGDLAVAFDKMTKNLKETTTSRDLLDEEVTERKKAEEVIKEHAKQLEHSNQLKDLFTDIMRHDLLNPVGIIGNITEMLEGDKTLKDSSEISAIKRNVKKLKEIIYNASDYAKLESAEKLEKSELDIAKIIEIVIEDFDPYLKDVGMNVEFKPKGEYKASASPMIESVFINLMSNAIKYSPVGTGLKIAIEDSGDNWTVSFADRGEGIRDEYKEAIFDRFTRKDKKGVKGTGFGLAIVKRIVEMHDGRAWVEDNPVGGSIFYVEIPKSSE